MGRSRRQQNPCFGCCCCCCCPTTEKKRKRKRRITKKEEKEKLARERERKRGETLKRGQRTERRPTAVEPPAERVTTPASVDNETIEKSKKKSKKIKSRTITAHPRRLRFDTDQVIVRFNHFVSIVDDLKNEPC